MYRILLISHDFASVSHLEKSLRQEKMTAHRYNLKYLDISSVKHAYDLYLLHVKDTEKQNVDRFVKLRNLTTKPIFILSEDFLESKILHYLNLGADHYIDLKIPPKQTSSAIKAILHCIDVQKRTPKHSTTSIGPYRYCRDEHCLYQGKTKTSLTAKECEILNVLLKNRGSTVSREKIIDTIYTLEKAATDNALNIIMNRLRNKMKSSKDDDIIETVWGFGYRINDHI
jgi:DNA-binding response OmpR family regulator